MYLGRGDFITNETEFNCSIPTSWSLIVQSSPQALIAEKMLCSQELKGFVDSLAQEYESGTVPWMVLKAFWFGVAPTNILQEAQHCQNNSSRQGQSSWCDSHCALLKFIIGGWLPAIPIERKNHFFLLKCLPNTQRWKAEAHCHFQCNTKIWKTNTHLQLLPLIKYKIL